MRARRAHDRVYGIIQVQSPWLTMTDRDTTNVSDYILLRTTLLDTSGTSDKRLPDHSHMPLTGDTALRTTALCCDARCTIAETSVNPRRACDVRLPSIAGGRKPADLRRGEALERVRRSPCRGGVAVLFHPCDVEGMTNNQKSAERNNRNWRNKRTGTAVRAIVRLRR